MRRIRPLLNPPGPLSETDIAEGFIPRRGTRRVRFAGHFAGARVPSFALRVWHTIVPGLWADSGIDLRVSGPVGHCDLPVAFDGQEFTVVGEGPARDLTIIVMSLDDPGDAQSGGGSSADEMIEDARAVLSRRLPFPEAVRQLAQEAEEGRRLRRVMCEMIGASEALLLPDLLRQLEAWLAS